MESTSSEANALTSLHVWIQSGRAKPALPTQPKPPVPSLLSPRPSQFEEDTEHKSSNASLSNDYENDYNPKGSPVEVSAATQSGESAPAKTSSSSPKETPKLDDSVDDESSDSGYIDTYN